MVKVPENLPLPDDQPFNWDPKPNEHYLKIKDGEGLFNRLNELTHLYQLIPREVLQDIMEKHFFMIGR